SSMISLLKNDFKRLICLFIQVALSIKTKKSSTNGNETRRIIAKEAASKLDTVSFLFGTYNGVNFCISSSQIVQNFLNGFVCFIFLASI
ncbi:MAG TPA: hypothetical protein VHA52_09545, partial [Candidatus Babeliaceae bacterium]|nr:hypothetical protein [Candidatus Babeliaceae bacterium]